MASMPEPVPLTIAAIHRWHEARRGRDRWNSIPISMLGNPCDRAIWYAFRWAHESEPFDGRMLRLFETGEREEARMLDELRAIGCQVEGEQERVQAANNHMRGMLDGKVLGLPEAPATWHVVECKTHSAKSFRELVKKGVAEAKPKHWLQCQLYMHLTGLTRCLYIAHNKDTDELHTERLRHDEVACLRAIARAERLVASDDAPARLHEDPTKKGAFHCLHCPARGVCHEGQWAPRSCRTCLNVTPIDGGKWRCERHGHELNLNEQILGCPDHRYLPDLVPGKQVDADEAGGTVTYALDDGRTWVDGGAHD